MTFNSSTVAGYRTWYIGCGWSHIIFEWGVPSGPF